MFVKVIFFQILLVYSFAESLILPIPLNTSYNKQKALLGKELFFEKKISPNKNLSCASCHRLFSGGVDNNILSDLDKSSKTSFNTMTVFNAIYNYKNFWDGRAENLEEQLNDSFNSFLKTKNDKINFMESLSPMYKKKFKKIYKDGFIYKNLLDSLVEFQKTLTTPNAPFDKYLRGDKNALNYKEIRGYEIFKSVGCIACHNGINLGANSYSNIKINTNEGNSYKGCYGKTVSIEKSFLVKVPSLRNIEITAPYFHDGKMTKLNDAIHGASTHALKRKLSANDITFITHFLKTLTGEMPKTINNNK